MMFDVFDFGAVGDGETLDTEAVQLAINACTDAGGGVVYFPKGFYVIGSIFLRDNVTLEVSPEAVILGSTDIADYKGEWGTLIGASGARNIRIVGAGKIDGQGAEFPGDMVGRPRLMYFRDCLNCTIDGVTLRNAASWCVHTVQCDNLRLVNLNVFNRVRPNNDAFDIDSCQDVFVSNCNISSGDDAIALKNTIKRPCRNIVVSNCVISSRWAAFRFGPESLGGFQNITVSNCVIYDTYGCGIKLQVNEGGVMENITFSNIVMENVTGPISLRLAEWEREPGKAQEFPPIGKLRDIMMSNMRIKMAEGFPPLEAWEHAEQPGELSSCISIMGSIGHDIEGITFENIDVTYTGGGTKEDADRRELPDLQKQYPEYYMFGAFPAYGFYARHAHGIALSNVRFRLGHSDLRPVIVCDDVENLEIVNMKAEVDPDAGEMIRLQNVRDAFIHASRPLGEANSFLRIEGANSKDILLQGNDFRRVRKACTEAIDISDDAVTIA